MKNLIPLTTGLFIIVSTARADFVIYTNRSEFNASSLGLQIIDFTGLSGAGGYYGLGLTGTVDGVTFSTTAPFPGAGGLAILDPSNYDYTYYSYSGEYLFNNAGTSGIYISLPPGTTAFGADFFANRMVGVGSPYPAPSVLATISIQEGAIYQFTTQTSPNSTFWGFTSDVPITGITYDTGIVGYYGTHAESIDNVSFEVTPEPSTAALTALGLGVLAIRQHHRITRKIRA